LSSIFTTHKGTPQGSILSPILFNIYLRELGRFLYEETEFLQYADDIVIFSRNKDFSKACYSINKSLELIYAFLWNKGLELSPSRSKYLVFSRHKKHREKTAHLIINNIEISQVESTSSWVLDNRLSGADHIKFLIKKGYNIVRIITSLAGTKYIDPYTEAQ